MNRVTALWDREPVALLATVEALVALALAFGLDLTGEQVGAIVAAAAVLLGATARGQVTPVASPHAADGAPLHPSTTFVAGAADDVT